MLNLILSLVREINWRRSAALYSETQADALFVHVFDSSNDLLDNRDPGGKVKHPSCGVRRQCERKSSKTND